MKRFTDSIINIIIKFLEIISSVMKFRLRGKVAGFVGSVVFIFARERKKVALKNLQLSFPDKQKIWFSRISHKAFQNIAITFFELLAQRKIRRDAVSEQIRYENLELITEAYNRGKGVILLSGHYGNWELLALSAGLFTGIPVLVVVQKQKFWDRQITEARTRFGNSVVERGSAARKLVAALKNKGMVALLADQSPPERDGIYVDFFSRRTLTYRAPAELALKFGAAVIAGFAVREKDYTYSVVLEEVIHEGLEYNEAGIKEFTQRYSALIERKISEHPHLWAWQHKRWKKTPELNDY